MLNKNPFPKEEINRGPYRLGKNITDANTYRIGHQLAQKIINQFKSIKLPVKELIFDYTNTNKKISILEESIGKSGWLCLHKVTIDSFETEDYLFFAGYSEDGKVLDSEQCQRLFSIPATLNDINSINYDKNKIDEILHSQKSVTLSEVAGRNSKFFDAEMDKLDKWAEDRKNSLEIELKNLDKEIKTQKTESKKILNLEEKVKMQREIKEMENKRNKMRRELFDAQDELERQKETLIADIESRLKQKITEEDLFLIKWTLI